MVTVGKQVVVKAWKLFSGVMWSWEMVNRIFGTRFCFGEWGREMFFLDKGLDVLASELMLAIYFQDFPLLRTGL